MQILNSKIVLVLLISLTTTNCKFLNKGANGDGDDGGQRFSGNYQTSTDANAQYTVPNGTGTGTVTSTLTTTDTSTNGDSAIDYSKYKPMTVTMLRRDNSTSGRANTSLSIKLRDGKDTQKKTLASEGGAVTFERMCPPSGKASYDVAFLVGQAGSESTYKPNKNVSGGPIGFRRSETLIWIGFELTEVGGKSAYHNNDDMVIELSCPDSTRIEIPELCLDTRIPDGAGTQGGIHYSGPGSDLVTDENTMYDSFGRQCNGT